MTMPFRFVVVFLLAGAIAYALSIYYSDKNRSERAYQAMLASGQTELAVIQNYLDHHSQKTDDEYDYALRLAAALDSRYLDKVIDYYTSGRLILDTATADIILQQLPSDSIKTNYAAGRIYATNEFNRYHPRKAIKHLEYAALRGDYNAAASLSKIFTQYKCYVGAITWARQANKRDVSSECTQLPVNMNRLNEDEVDATVYNEQEFEIAEREKRLPVLKYARACKLKQPDAK